MISGCSTHRNAGPVELTTPWQDLQCHGKNLAKPGRYIIICVSLAGMGPG